MKRQQDEPINKRCTRPNDQMFICERSIKILRHSNSDNYQGDTVNHIHIFKGFTHKSNAKLQLTVTFIVDSCNYFIL